MNEYVVQETVVSVTAGLSSLAAAYSAYCCLRTRKKEWLTWQVFNLSLSDFLCNIWLAAFPWRPETCSLRITVYFMFGFVSLLTQFHIFISLIFIVKRWNRAMTIWCSCLPVLWLLSVAGQTVPLLNLSEAEPQVPCAMHASQRLMFMVAGYIAWPLGIGMYVYLLAKVRKECPASVARFGMNLASRCLAAAVVSYLFFFVVCVNVEHFAPDSFWTSKTPGVFGAAWTMLASTGMLNAIVYRTGKMAGRSSDTLRHVRYAPDVSVHVLQGGSGPASLLQ